MKVNYRGNLYTHMNNACHCLWPIASLVALLSITKRVAWLSSGPILCCWCNPNSLMLHWWWGPCCHFLCDLGLGGLRLIFIVTVYVTASRNLTWQPQPQVAQLIIKWQRAVARQVCLIFFSFLVNSVQTGKTVTLTNLFISLPVWRKEMSSTNSQHPVTCPV